MLTPALLTAILLAAANDGDAADADAYAYDSTGDSGAANDDDVPRERSAGESASPPGIGT